MCACSGCFRNAGSLEALGLLHLVFSPAFFGLEIAEIGPASSVLRLLFWFAFFFFFSVAALSVVFWQSFVVGLRLLLLFFSLSGLLTIGDCRGRCCGDEEDVSECSTCCGWWGFPGLFSDKALVVPIFFCTSWNCVPSGSDEEGEEAVEEGRRRRLRLFFSPSSGLLLRVLWPVFAGRKTDSSERVSCTLSELFFALEEAAATSFFYFTFFFFCCCWLLSTLVALPFEFLRRHRHRFFRNKSDVVVVPLQVIYWTDSSSCCCFLRRRRKGMKLLCSANTWLSEKLQLSSPFAWDQASLHAQSYGSFVLLGILRKKWTKSHPIPKTFLVHCCSAGLFASLAHHGMFSRSFVISLPSLPIEGCLPARVYRCVKSCLSANPFFLTIAVCLPALCEPSTSSGINSPSFGTCPNKMHWEPTVGLELKDSGFLLIFGYKKLVNFFLQW